MDLSSDLDPVHSSTILVIQETSVESYLWERYSLSAGFKLSRANTESEARRLIQQGTFLMVIFDLGLYTPDWKDLLSEMKADPLTHHIPVLVCSTSEEELLKMITLADGYLRKPILYPNFLSALEKLGVSKPGSR